MSKVSGFDLSGKVVVVTGASSGIGAASAKIIGDLGAKVLLVARDEQALGRVQASIVDGGGTAETFRADMGAQADVLAAIDHAEAKLGPIDCYFANAGIGGPKRLMVDYQDEDFEAVLTVNLRSVFWAMRRVLPGMIERRRGSVLVTGSLGSERGLPFGSAYNVSKHAVLGLVRSAAAEVSAHNVRVNAIIPGLINTRMIDELASVIGDGDVDLTLGVLGGMVPLGRVGTPNELGQVAAFLLSDAASYVTGQAWAVDGGILHTQIPGK